MTEFTMAEFMRVKKALTARIDNWEPMPMEDVSKLAQESIALLDKLLQDNIELKQKVKKQE
jgi:hypothetical protein